MQLNSAKSSASKRSYSHASVGPEDELPIVSNKLTKLKDNRNSSSYNREEITITLSMKKLRKRTAEKKQQSSQQSRPEKPEREREFSRASSATKKDFQQTELDRTIHEDDRLLNNMFEKQSFKKLVSAYLAIIATFLLCTGSG